MLGAVEGNIHQRLCALFDGHQARYWVMAHNAVDQCEAVSTIRGTALGQGAEALACKVKGDDVNQRVLAILAVDQQAGLASLARHIGGSGASLTSPTEVDVPTTCVFDAIPPFNFHPVLWLVADSLLFERSPQIAFDAGRLDRSIILDAEDYLHIARPEIATSHRLSQPDIRPNFRRMA